MEPFKTPKAATRAAFLRVPGMGVEPTLALLPTGF